jgi:hypothetical protein
MQKYAAATALVIALNITMFTPAVSGTPYCYAGTLSCACSFKCAVEHWNTEKMWDSDHRHGGLSTQTCIAKCMAAKTAAQR